MVDRDAAILEAELHAYVDGELPADRRKAVEAWLALHPDDAARVDAWRRQAEEIRAGLDEAGGFLPFVFGTDPADDRGEPVRTAMRRYATFLARSHQADRPVS